MSKETMIVLTTCGNDEDAGALARTLVEGRLAACVNTVGRVTSTYRWKGEVQQDQETLLIIKTCAERLAAVEKAIREQSKYELPELIALPVAAGGADYLAWIRESVGELKD
ncbi:MAG TPA: divalent-cation tolerance protein CutA [Gammaproteobacteria bacterium]|nr:divalent-cation tolerance protein CutA [Gammaproteobacteria bacterium]